MKKKNIRNIIIIVLWVVVLVVLGIKVYQYLNPKNDNTPQNDINNNEKPEEGKIVTNKEYIELLNTLYSYGEPIYDNEKYLNYKAENEEGAYFISLEKLHEDFNYDISIFVDKENNECNHQTSGIYFRPNEETAEGFKPLSFSLNDCYTGASKYEE